MQKNVDKGAKKYYNNTVNKWVEVSAQKGEKYEKAVSG